MLAKYKIIILCLVIWLGVIPSSNATAANEFLRITVPNFYPLGYQDKDGEIKGLYVDLISHVLSKLSINHIFIWGRTWVDSMQALEDGNLDILASMSYRADRAEQMSFLMPASVEKYSVVVNRNFPKQHLHSMADFSAFDLPIILSTNVAISPVFDKRYAEDAVFRQRFIRFDFQSIQPLYEQERIVSRLKLINDHSISGMLVETRWINESLRQLSTHPEFLQRVNSIKVIDADFLTQETIYFVANAKLSLKTVKSIREAYQQALDSGEIAAIYQQWLPDFDIADLQQLDD